jgi:signal transduction histidine kinase
MGENNGDFSLVYEDDGKGFDCLMMKKGLGLRNIENRVALIDGSMCIDSSEMSNGTSIIIEVVC